MDEELAPTSVPSETITPDEQQSAPERSGKRVIGLIIGGLVVLIVLVIVVWGFIFLLRGSAGDSVPSPTTTPLPNGSQAVELPPERVAQDNLFVQVQRSAGPAFGVEILAINRTVAIPTIHSQEPSPDNPHSLIQQLDATGTLINQFRFALPTQVTLEAEGQPGTVYDLPPTPFDMYIPVPSGAVPAMVRVTSSNGTVLVEQAIEYQALPELPDQSDILAPTDPGVFSWLERLGLVSAASAQNSPAGQVVIGITHHRGGNMAAAEGAAQLMSATISPWSLYAQVTRIEAVPLVNDNLGCRFIRHRGIDFPNCSNSGAVIAAVQREVPDWDVIAVAMDTDCNCGTAVFDSKVVAVGNFISDQILAHEFAHAIPGALADEYLGDIGESGPIGPNCFGNKQLCEDTMQLVFDNVDDPNNAPPEPLDPAGGTNYCTQGCNNQRTWRPASSLMYNVPVGFGPYEHELVCRNIGRLADTTCQEARGGFPNGIGNGTGNGNGGGPTDPPLVSPDPSTPPESCTFCTFARCFLGDCVCVSPTGGPSVPPSVTPAGSPLPTRDPSDPPLPTADPSGPPATVEPTPTTSFFGGVR